MALLILPGATSSLLYFLMSSRAFATCSGVTPSKNLDIVSQPFPSVEMCPAR